MLKALLTSLALGAALLQTGCAGSSTPAQAQSVAVAPDATALRQQLTDLKASTGVRGLLASVRVGETEVLSLALGDSMTDIPADVKDHVRIGGISETMLGTIVMRLVEQNRISLADPVSKYTPGVFRSSEVTLDMLIHNTSGYPDYVLDPDFIKRITDHPFDRVSHAEIIDASTHNNRLNWEPGTQQHYSHTDFTVLGDVLEKATSSSMEELYKQLIFQPANLKDSGYSHNAALPDPVLHAFDDSRGPYEDVTFYNPTWTGDSGPIWSTLDEVARWAHIWGQGQLLTPESYRIQTGKPAIASRSDLYIGMGFVYQNGWLSQNPAFNGYAGGMAYDPTTDVTIVIFTTRGTDPRSESQAYQILKQIVSTLTPSRPLLL
ncbi:hypothetical protein ABS71_07290 [bacterium SCN 62-11]|nr:beta-lactamase family protein [Candidatus Eremiobacteraeota bacterium]ODT73364.1 MAG: hypothetical protein ABS71_07290 [bacterium SCN 62-11]